MKTPGSFAAVLCYFIASPYSGPTYKIRAISLYSTPYNFQQSGIKLSRKIFRFCSSTIQKDRKFSKT